MLFRLPIAMGIFVVLATGFTVAMTGEAAEPGKVLRHLVLYKFRDDATPEQVQEVIDTFAALPEKIDTIIGFEHGKNVSEEGKSDGLTYCFAVTFRDKQGLETYLVHPAHQEYVKVVSPRREKVVVFDYWTEE